jgi:hypothetical protein
LIVRLHFSPGSKKGLFIFRRKMWELSPEVCPHSTLCLSASTGMVWRVGLGNWSITHGGCNILPVVYWRIPQMFGMRTIFLTVRAVFWCLAALCCCCVGATLTFAYLLDCRCCVSTPLRSRVTESIMSDEYCSTLIIQNHLRSSSMSFSSQPGIFLEPSLSHVQISAALPWE